MVSDPNGVEAGEAVAPTMSRSMTLIVSIAATAVVIWGLRSIAGIAGPALLALVLLVTVYPVRGWLTRLRLPSWMASLGTVIAVYIVVILLLLSLILAIDQLITLVPTYSGQFNTLMNNLGTWLRRQGISQGQINEGLSKLDIGQLVPVLQSLASRILSFLTNLLLFGLLVVFSAFDAPGFVHQLRTGRESDSDIVHALSGFASGVRRYFAVSAAFGLVCAALNWFVLLALGIPAAFTWGLLSFVTNFVPNIGFIVGMVPPALLALLNGGVSEMIIVIGAYIAINFVVQSLIQPKVVGDALGLTATIAFGSLIFWAYVLGPIGTILALPMTLFVKALFVDADPSKAWLQPLLSGNKTDPGAEPKPRLHRRLLRLR